MRLTRTFARAALLAAGTALVAPRSADAAFTFTVLEQGGNVVGTGTGSINTTSLTAQPVGQLTSGLISGVSAAILIGTGATPSEKLVSRYIGFTGPKSFGAGGLFLGGVTSGADFLLNGTAGLLGVELGYVSGTNFTTGLTFTNATFASIGLTPGTYVWTWGSGQTADSLTVQIGVPEPASMALLGAGLLGLGAAMRRRRAA